MQIKQAQVSVGYTLNLGNYENMRFDVSLTAEFNADGDMYGQMQDLTSEAIVYLSEAMDPTLATLQRWQICQVYERLGLECPPDEEPETVTPIDPEVLRITLEALEAVFEQDVPTPDGDELDQVVQQNASEKPEDRSIPYYVIDALEEVRVSGKVNMLDRQSVIEMLWGGSWNVAEWLVNNPDRYMDALVEMGSRVSQK